MWKAILPAFALAGCTAQPAIAPGGIVSANPCIDGILAQIATPGQIAAVSAFSHDPAAGSAPMTWAKRYPAIGITAEEVIAAHPRLLLTGDYMSAATRDAIAQARIPTIALGVPATIAASEDQIATIAHAIGRQDAGRALIAAIERAVSTEPVNGRPKSAIIWLPSDFVPGKGTVQDELLKRAGFANASATYGLTQWGQLTLETLLTHPPDVIFMPVAINGQEARIVAARQRILARFGNKTRVVAFPERLLYCAGPTMIEAVTIMRRANSR